MGKLKAAAAAAAPTAKLSCFNHWMLRAEGGQESTEKSQEREKTNKKQVYSQTVLPPAQHFAGSKVVVLLPPFWGLETLRNLQPHQCTFSAAEKACHNTQIGCAEKGQQ